MKEIIIKIINLTNKKRYGRYAENAWVCGVTKI